MFILSFTKTIIYFLQHYCRKLNGVDVHTDKYTQLAKTLLKSVFICFSFTAQIVALMPS
jgi:hypothetical protein